MTTHGGTPGGLLGFPVWKFGLWLGVWRVSLGELRPVPAPPRHWLVVPRLAVSWDGTAGEAETYRITEIGRGTIMTFRGSATVSAVSVIFPVAASYYSKRV